MNSLILASGHLGQQGIDAFWNTGAGRATGTVLGVVGLFVLIGFGFKAFRSFADGKTGAGVKLLIGGGMLAAILINPSLLTGLVDLMGRLFSLVTDSGSELVQ